MRVDIALTKLQRKKLRLLVAGNSDAISPGTLVAYLLNVYLAKHKIRVCAADRCEREFAFEPEGPNRHKRYCSNACRVWQSRQRGGV